MAAKTPIPVTFHASDGERTLSFTPAEWERYFGKPKPIPALAASNFAPGDYPKGDR